MTSPFNTTERLDILTREVDAVGPHHFAKADVAAALDEIARLRARVVDLEKADATLTALYAAGVDNWDGFDEAVSGS